jgi:membrane associated rhomboid family serine protease
VAFIPLYDGTPLRYIGRPWVTWSLIAINVAIFFLVERGGIHGADRASVVDYGLIPALLENKLQRPSDLVDIPNWLTLGTHAFLHGDLWHLGGNMIFLWVFADNIEDSLGHVRFLLFYFLCAIAGGYAYVLSDTASLAPLIGASGAIAGIVAAYFILYPYAKVWILAFGRIPLHLNAVWVLGFWILFQVYAVVGGSGDSEVAWWTHLGGLVTGAMLVPILRRPGVKLFSRPEPVLPGLQTMRLPPMLPAPPLRPEAEPSVDGPWSRR